LAALEGGERGLAFEMAPEERSEHIGQTEIERQGGDRSRCETPVDLFRRHVVILVVASSKGNVGWTLRRSPVRNLGSFANVNERVAGGHRAYMMAAPRRIS